MPEAADGGPLALLEEGDEIEINLRRGDIELLVEDGVLDTRESAWTPPPPTRERGWLAQYSRLVQPIERGRPWCSLLPLPNRQRRRWVRDSEESEIQPQGAVSLSQRKQGSRLRKEKPWIKLVESVKDGEQPSGR